MASGQTLEARTWTRSLGINEEINLVVSDGGVATQLEQSFHEDLKYSNQLTYEAWSSRPFSEKILEMIMLPAKDQM